MKGAGRVFLVRRAVTRRFVWTRKARPARRDDVWVRRPYRGPSVNSANADHDYPSRGCGFPPHPGCPLTPPAPEAGAGPLFPSIASGPPHAAPDRSVRTRPSWDGDRGNVVRIGRCGTIQALSLKSPNPLIPAKAGIHVEAGKLQTSCARLYPSDWIPAFAGMSGIFGTSGMFWVIPGAGAERRRPGTQCSELCRDWVPALRCAPAGMTGRAVQDRRGRAAVGSVLGTGSRLSSG